MKKLLVLTLAASLGLSLNGCLSMLSLDSEVAAKLFGAPPAGEEPAAKPEKPAKPAAQPAPAAKENQGPKTVKGKKIDAKAMLAQFKAASNSGKKFGAGADLSKGVMAFTGFKGGEWVAYRILENGEVQGVFKWAIVGQKQGEWQFEFVSVQKDGVTAMQMSVKGLETIYKTGDPDQGTISQILVKDENGEITVIDGMMLGMMGGAYKGFLGQTATQYKTVVTPGGDITVPAGTFAATWKVKSTLAGKRETTEGEVWVSTQVPFTRMVKSVSNDKKTVLELVDFGSSGYVSEF